MSELQDLVCVITGGASGIGLSTAQLFKSKGAKTVVFDINVDQLPDGIYGYEANVRDKESLKLAVEKLISEHGQLDVLVNNAGVSAVGTIEDATEEEWQKVLGINVIGVANVTAACLPYLRQSPHASVVNLCSIAALNGLPQRAIYSASKGAVLSMTFAMATDHVKEGIRFNCVSPGTVSTPFVEKMLLNFDDPVGERAALEARQATGRMVTPDEVAYAILYLAGPHSGSTTGTALDVDGGMTHLRVRQ